MQYGSDNQTGASPKILDMLNRANTGHAHGYGDDAWSNRAVDELKRVFDCDLEACFVSTGTAANCLGLSCMVQPWEMALCHHQAHIINDESTAPEFLTGGARLVPISGDDLKLTVRHIDDFFYKAGTHVPHNAIAKAISLTQANELGQIYTPDEVGRISERAKANGLRVHMDGARFANAVAALECDPADITWKAGVDVLSLGVTKNGGLCAESVIFFDTALSETFAHRRKRTGHLISKGRLFGAQFVGWLEDDHWLDMAKHANAHARKLSKALSGIKGVRLAWPDESNELFAIMPTPMVEALREAGAEFYDWTLEALPASIHLKKGESFVRLVTSFMSEDAHLEAFMRIAEGAK